MKSYHPFLCCDAILILMMKYNSKNRYTLQTLSQKHKVKNLFLFCFCFCLPLGPSYKMDTLESKGLTHSNLNSVNLIGCSDGSYGKGQSTSYYEDGKVLKYGNLERLKGHIEKVAKNAVKAREIFHGIEELKIAAKSINGQKPILRVGQIIFGSVSLAHTQGWDGPKSFFGNLLAPWIIKYKTSQARQYPYLHSAIYAGKVHDNHYVIENGGGYPRIGMVSALTLEEAFESSAKFFVLSPPKDSRGRSTRHLVLQRALTCLGIYFDYHIRAVSCETFTMSILLLEAEHKPIQANVLKPTKGHEITDEKKEYDQTRFTKFHNDLFQMLEMNSKDLILTLKYYLETNTHKMGTNFITDKPNYTSSQLNGKSPIWWFTMITDYDELLKAIKDSDTEKCQVLTKKGLDISSKVPINDDHAHQRTTFADFMKRSDSFEIREIAFAK